MAWFLAVLVVLVSGHAGGPRVKIGESIEGVDMFWGRLVLLREIFTNLQLPENSDIIYCHMI